MGTEFGEPLKLDITPGIYTEDTDSGSMGRWVDCDLVRFKNGLPQSIGGWVKKTLTGSTLPLFGIPRSNHDWVALNGVKYIAIGTEKRLYIIEESLAVTNITPIRSSGALANPFSTDTTGAYDPIGSDPKFFRYTHTAHGVSKGDIVEFDSYTSPVGGITVNGAFEVAEITDANNYVIKGAEAATSTVTLAGGTGNFTYEITVGSGVSGVALGYGSNLYNTDTYNTPRTSSTFTQDLRTWSLENWGEDLIASPRAGKIYTWDKSVGLGTRATEITQAPATNLRVIVSPENRQLIALGAHNGTTNDPLFVAWTDNEDFTTWIPSSTNTAGDKRLDQGAEVVAGVPTRVGILVFTDRSIHVMQPTGGNEIYSFRQVGSGISIVGPSAAVDANGIVYFMGSTNFYTYDGTLRVLPCPVWTTIYDKDERKGASINLAQSHSVFCSHCKDFNEVWWFYPRAGKTANDRYVVYNYVENIWYYGKLDRASFHDFSPFFEAPFGFDNAGNLFLHESGEDADGLAMSTFIESSEMSIADGDQLMFVNKLIPDFDRIQGSVDVELKGRKYPQKGQFTKGPYIANSSSDEMGVRIRARHLAIRVSQNAIGSSFRMGSWRARMRPDGER